MENPDFPDLAAASRDIWDQNARWWDAGVGYYREGPDQIFLQTMQVLPLAFDLVPDDKRADLEAKLGDQ